MKFLKIAPIVIILLATGFSSTYFFHEGGVDKRGGHIDPKDNTYHYHHGCEAHQHPNGTCKFDFKNCDRNDPKERDHEHPIIIE